MAGNAARWLELSVTVPSELAEPVAYLFRKYARGLVIEEEPGSHVTTLRAYLSPRARKSQARIDVGIRLIHTAAGTGELVVREVAEDEWERAWKAHFTLLKVGRRLVVRPPWMAYTPAEGELVITLDPGMAFGTGHHPTTRLCLELLEELVKPGAAVLDLGTGSGILTVAAVKLGAGSVVALDVDPLAVRVARQGLRANEIRRGVRVARGTLPHPLAPEGSMDLAVANISSKVVKDSAAHLWRVLKPGGLLISSGYLADQAAEVEDVLKAAGLAPVQRRTQEGWAATVSERRH